MGNDGYTHIGFFDDDFDFDDEQEKYAIRIEFNDGEAGYFHKTFWENDQDYDGLAEISPYYKPGSKIIGILGRVLPWGTIEAWMWSLLNIEIIGYGVIEPYSPNSERQYNPTVEEVVDKAGYDLRIRIIPRDDDTARTGRSLRDVQKITQKRW